MRIASTFVAAAALSAAVIGTGGTRHASLAGPLAVQAHPKQVPARLSGAAPDVYGREIEAWRARRDASLRAEDGWLTLVGLFWLDAGEQHVGSAVGSSCRLPPSAPAHVGTLTLAGGVVTFRSATGTDVRLGNAPLTERVLRDDQHGTPDQLRFGTYSMLLIRRGTRLGLRVRDTASDQRRAFTGERWFPVSEAWRIDARWVGYDAPRPSLVRNVIGDDVEMLSPGYALFRVDGREARLDAVFEGADREQLMFIFKDRTAGVETYPAGRFLYADLPEGERVVLDLNKAHNPPCAFTPFATCPLPPPGNQLPFRIEAGALNYGH